MKAAAFKCGFDALLCARPQRIEHEIAEETLGERLNRRFDALFVFRNAGDQGCFRNSGPVQFRNPSRCQRNRIFFWKFPVKNLFQLRGGTQLLLTCEATKEPV